LVLGEERFVANPVDSDAMAIRSVTDFIPRFWPDMLPGKFDGSSQRHFKVFEDLRPRSPGQPRIGVLPTELKMAEPVPFGPPIEGGKGFFSLVIRDEWEEPRRRMPRQWASVKPESKFAKYEDRADTLQRIISE
jgi:hypothetical protein